MGVPLCTIPDDITYFPLLFPETSLIKKTAIFK